MNWKELYQQKCVSSEEAVSHIKSGDRVVFTHATGESTVLSEALVKRRESLQDVEIVHMVVMSAAEYCQPGIEQHFRHNSLFLGGSTRKAIEEGRGDLRRFSSLKSRNCSVRNCIPMWCCCCIFHPWTSTAIAATASRWTILSPRLKLPIS